MEGLWPVHIHFNANNLYSFSALKDLKIILSIIKSFIHLLVNSFNHPSIHPLTYLLTCSLAHPSNHHLTQLLIHSLSQSYRPLDHNFSYSVTHLLIHPHLQPFLPFMLLHGIWGTQKTTIWMFIAVKTSNHNYSLNLATYQIIHSLTHPSTNSSCCLFTRPPISSPTHPSISC